MKLAGISVQDEKIRFQSTKDSIQVMLAQISPAYDQELFAKEGLVKVKNPDNQRDRIIKIIEHAFSMDVDVLIFPELVAPFRHLEAFEEVIKKTEKDIVVCICYEHTLLKDLIAILQKTEIEQHGFVTTKQDTKLVNFCRIVMNVGSQLRAFTQIKLTPFSGEFSLSAKDTLYCGKVIHRFITNWGNFLFLICKDYVGEIGTKRKIPMFDFLKSLADKGLHYVFVSSLNPEAGAFIHAARSFYYLQEKSNNTFTLFLNTAELNNTTIVFPVRPHPKVRSTKETEILPLFESKPGWGTQLRFSGYEERVITSTLVRLDTYKPMPTKEIFSPVYQTGVHDLAALGIESEKITPPEVIITEEKMPPKPVHNLPPQTTPFVGREKELTEITKLLDDPSCRLLTLLGPGGIGKTRLALQAATEKIGKFSNGVYFVSLAPLSTTDFLVSTIANSFEFSFRGREDPKVQLLNFLREKEMLLVMDNFEHLLEAAGLLAEILENVPRIKIMVTSRERLNLKGEWISEVHGMSFPESETVDRVETYSAVQLFLDGARRVSPNFSFSDEDKPNVIRICRLVEGTPLAIELSSSWLSALSCKDVAKEIERDIDFLATSMRDVPKRHRSIRAVFEHSWNLLSEEERSVFMKLSIFRGGFRREAAEEVAKASPLLLLSLVDKSLLRRESSKRYELHELLRQYAEEKLNEVPKEEENVHHLHCGYYTEFLHKKKELLKGKKQRETLEEVGAEIENVRAAWLWAVKLVNEKALARSLGSLWRFYMIRGWYKEGDELFGRAVDELAEQGEIEAIEKEKSSLLGTVLARQGVFSHQLGLYERARELLQKSLLIFRKLDARKEIAETLNELSHVSFVKGDFSKAKQILEESLSIYREIGHRKGMAVPLTSLGNLAHRLGELKEARQHYNESYAIYKEMDDQWGMAILLMNLGNIAHELGEHNEAKRLYTESLTISRELGDRRSIASILNNIGNVAKDIGEYTDAKKLYQESLEIKREIGDKKGIANSLGNLGNVASILGEYDEAKKRHQETLTLCREIGFRWGMVSALVGLGNDECGLGKYRESQKYFREALRTAMEIPAVPLVLDVLVGIASRLTKEKKKERAFELISFVLCNPSSYIHTRNTAESLRSELASELPSEVVATIEERGKSRRLEELVVEIVEEKNGV